MSAPFVAVEGQCFTSHQQWVNKASSWLTQHQEYNNTEHGENRGWRGAHFTTLCFDQQGRRVRNGADFQRAHDEGTFPIWWVWPDQIAELLMAPSKAEAERLRTALAGVRANLVRLAWEENSVMIEGIDAALSGSLGSYGKVA